MLPSNHANVKLVFNDQTAKAVYAETMLGSSVAESIIDVVITQSAHQDSVGLNRVGLTIQKMNCDLSERAAETLLILSPAFLPENFLPSPGAQKAKRYICSIALVRLITCTGAKLV